MTKYIFSVPFTAYEETRLLVSVVVAADYISAHGRLVADDPIWRRGSARFLHSYPSKGKASIAFSVQ